MSESPESEPRMCTVISCPNYEDKSLNPSNQEFAFFPFPRDREIARTWKEKCGVAADHETKSAKVCAEHFRGGDFLDAATLKSDAIPRKNLGWMFGMPEVKPVNPPKFELVKEAVDTNERLLKRIQELGEEQKPLKTKIELYEKKINNVKKEIHRITCLLAKMPIVRRKNGKIDHNLICKVFSQAQINMLLNKKKVVWSYDDMAMAFTLRHIGNRECYLYLKNTLNMPLPSLSCVQRWVASNKP